MAERRQHDAREPSAESQDGGLGQERSEDGAACRAQSAQHADFTAALVGGHQEDQADEQ